MVHNLVSDSDSIIFRIYQCPVYYIPCIGIGQYIHNTLVSGVLYTLYWTRIVLYAEYSSVRCIIYLVQDSDCIIYRIHQCLVYFIPCIGLGLYYIQNILVFGVLYTLYRTRIVLYTEYTSVRCIIYLVQDSDCIIYRIQQCPVYYIPCIGLGLYCIQNTLVSGVLYTVYRTQIVLYTEYTSVWCIIYLVQDSDCIIARIHQCPVYYIPCIGLGLCYIQNTLVSRVLYLSLIHI